jgi:hypothetical protein
MSPSSTHCAELPLAGARSTAQWRQRWSVRSEAVGVFVRCGFVDGCQCLQMQCLHGTVLHRRNAQRSQLPIGLSVDRPVARAAVRLFDWPACLRALGNRPDKSLPMKTRRQRSEHPFPKSRDSTAVTFAPISETDVHCAIRQLSLMLGVSP